MKKFLSPIHPVSPEIIEEYISHWTEFYGPKKTRLTIHDQVERYNYYVKDGIQKSYFIKDSREYVIAFTQAPSFTSIPESFLTQTPSNCYPETISDSHFFKLTYEKHQKLIQEHREIENLFRKLTEHFLIEMIERHYQLMAYNIESRFKIFMKKSPYIFSMIPNKDLASYLRIEPTNLS